MDADDRAIGASGGDIQAQSGAGSTSNAQSDPPASGHQAPVAPTAVAAEAAAPAQIHDANVREGGDAAEISVNIKFIHHESVSLVCAPTISIAELRRKVMEVEHARASSNDEDGGDPPRLRLIYKGKVLKDDQTLDAYNFQHEDTIHAVFGRPQPLSSPPAPAPPAQEQTNASASTEQLPGSVRGEVRDMGNGFVMGRFNIDADVDSAVPDLGSLIGSVISGAMFGGAGPATSAAPGVSTHVSFASGNVPASTAPMSTPYTGVSSSTTTSAYPTTSTSTITSAPYTTTANSSTSSTTPATTTSGVSPARAHFLAQATATTQHHANSAAAFQDQASVVRRMMPPIDLGPMSRPPALSEEMYDLGNAVREASDTFMALHRQLAYLSGRLLNENNLSSLERARLRMRMQQLGPVLHGASDLATSLNQLLAESSLGWPTRSTPATTSGASGPPPRPGSSAGTTPPRPQPSSDADAGQAASGSSIWDYLQSGRSSSQPGGSEPVDLDSVSAASAQFASIYDSLQRARNAAQPELDEARNHVLRPSGSAATGPSMLDYRQHGSNATLAGRRSSSSESNGSSPSVLNYLQRLSESAQLSTSGVAALGSILTETGNLLSQVQSSARPTNAPPSVQPSPVVSAISGVAANPINPTTLPIATTARTTSSVRARTASSLLPVISTTPISDLISATLDRCVGSLETDISEFYHLSSDYMRSMFPANQPESESRERRKEWRVRAMNEIETKAAYCCDEELVCRDDLLSPVMDAALDAFVRECLDASFLTSGVPADSLESPIHNAWVRIWSNVHLWVNRQPSSTGRLILSRILVEEVRTAAEHYDLQHLARKLYDRTMECTALAAEANAPTSHT